MNAIFCQRLKEFRKERRLTQRQLAAKLGTTEDCIFFWERGRSEPALDDLIRLADFYDISLDVLVGRREY